MHEGKMGRAGQAVRKRNLRRQLAGPDYAATDAPPTAPAGGDVQHHVAAARVALFARQLLHGCGHVGLYAAMAREVDTQALAAQLRADGCRLYLPRTVGHGREARLEYAYYGPHTALRRHPGGMLEPAPTAGEGPVATARLDAIVVPGVAFDLRGGRLGQGWGCYDRALADFRGLVVALAHGRQICGALPREDHDRAVDVVVTPFGVWS